MDRKVKVFSTPNCDLCERTRRFLTEKGVDFDYVDVTRDRDSLREMRELSRGARSAPVVSIGDKVVVGFNKDELEKAIGIL
jgi:glutaredoxin 3